MRLLERWRRFKARQPGPFYSYVWWETLVGFYLSLGVFLYIFLSMFLQFFSVLDLWWLFWVIGIAHIPLDWWWTRREIEGRKKYRIGDDTNG